MTDDQQENASRGLEHYRTVFENVPIPIREEDLSQLKSKIDAQHFQDFSALTSYLDEHVDFLEECARSVRVIDANPASIKMYNYSDKSELKTKVLKKVGPESLKFVRKAIEAIFLGATSGKSETAIYNSVGQRRTLITNWSILPGHEHDYSRSIICSVDVTEKLAAEEALKQSQKMEIIGQLTGGIAHDFNNLLAVIQGNLELLQLQSFDEAENAEMLADAYAASRRGAELIRNMMAFSRQENLEPEVIDANKLIRETERWISRTLPASIQIEAICQPQLLKIQVDPSRFQAAIVNIIVNARDAMPTGGHLSIETSNVRIGEKYLDDSGDDITPGRYVLISISDNGSGIPKSVQTRVFDPFYTTKGPGKGSGLGLSMVQGFVRQSGGAARVYSEVGIGTTFKLYFPAVEGSDASAFPTKPKIDAHAVDHTNARILVADDQIEILSLLVRILTSEGYTVLPVSSGDRAFELFQSDRDFDLLLTDIAMPGKLQGPALAKAIRAIDDSIPVIFLTGYAAEATAHRNGLLPTDIRLLKPISRDELLKAVSKAISED